MNRILLLEDDVSLIDGLVYSLKKNEFDVEVARTVCEAKQYLSELDRYDLLILDVTLPDGTGFDVCERVRKEKQQIPIIFLTASDEEVSIIRGLDSGGDDYITKPFDMDELLLRVGALLRRANIEKSRRIEIGGFVMDEEEHTAYLDGVEVPFTVREFDILYKLLSFPKKTFTRAQLMEMFWDYDSSATSRTVDVYMAKIREKTASAEGFEIVTVHGLGYKAVLK